MRHDCHVASSLLLLTLSTARVAAQPREQTNLGAVVATTPGHADDGRTAALAALAKLEAMWAHTVPPGPPDPNATREERQSRARKLDEGVAASIAGMRQAAEAYDAVPVDAWGVDDVEARRRLLMVGIDYWVTYEPATAIAAVDQYLALPPGDPSQRDMVVRAYLPRALVLAGDLERAVRRLTVLSHSVKEESKPEILLWLARALALAGRQGDARAALCQASRLMPPSVSSDDPRSVVRDEVDLSMRLLGSQFPSHMEVRRLEDQQPSRVEMVGRPMLIEFFATWCVPCLQGLIQLDEVDFHVEQPRAQVLAVAIPSEDGYLPDMRLRTTGGETVTIASDRYMAHLKEYRQRLALRLDVCALADDRVKSYMGGRVPVTLILDPTGQVVFVMTGSEAPRFARAALRAIPSERRGQVGARQVPKHGGSSSPGAP